MLNKLLQNNNPLHFWIVFLLAVFGYALITLNSNGITDFNLEIGLNNIFTFKTHDWIINLTAYFLFFVVGFELISVSKEFSDNFGIIFPSIIFMLFGNLILNFSLSLISALGVVIFIIIIKLNFQIFEKQRIYTDLFYIGFLTSLLTLLRPEFIALKLLTFIALIVLRAFNMKEYIVLIISFFVPFIFIDAIQYFFYNIHFFDWINYQSLKYNFDINLLTNAIYPLITLFIFSIFTLYRYLIGKAELKKIKSRRYNTWLNISLITLWGLFLLTAKIEFIYLIIVLLSLSFSIIISSIPKPIHVKLLVISLFLLNILIIFIR